MPAVDLLNAQNTDAVLLALIESAPPLPLTQGPACPTTSSQVSSVIQSQGLEDSCTAAGLWLLAGQWNRSHEISQDQHNPLGSYWHAIMHRIEGDYWNSKYWTRQTRKLPVRGQLVNTLVERADQLLQLAQSAGAGYNPDLNRLNSADSVSEGLVDLVEKVVTQETGYTQLAEQICWWEWQLLFLNSTQHS
jgi:hypothetical protein